MADRDDGVTDISVSRTPSSLEDRVREATNSFNFNTLMAGSHAIGSEELPQNTAVVEAVRGTPRRASPHPKSPALNRMAAGFVVLLFLAVAVLFAAVNRRAPKLPRPTAPRNAVKQTESVGSTRNARGDSRRSPSIVNNVKTGSRISPSRRTTTDVRSKTSRSRPAFKPDNSGFDRDVNRFVDQLR